MPRAGTLRGILQLEGAEHMAKFNAIVCEGLVHSYNAGESRQGRWIDARDIPLQHIPARLKDRKDAHPHGVPGLAWDLDKNEWRNMKNAVAHTRTLREVDVTL